MQNIHLIARPKIASHRVSLSALRFFATSAPHLARLFIFCNLSACTMEEVLEMYFGKFQTGAKSIFLDIFSASIICAVEQSHI